MSENETVWDVSLLKIPLLARLPEEDTKLGSAYGSTYQLAAALFMVTVYEYYFNTIAEA